MTAHTPGPWETDGIPCEVTGSISVYHNGPIVYVKNNGNGIDNQIANARLIAASPDLLSACEAMADFLLETHPENCIEGTANCSCHHATMWRHAQAAIRAAKGE